MATEMVPPPIKQPRVYESGVDITPTTPTTIKMWENVGNMISTFPDFLGNTLGFHDERPHFVAFPTIFTSLVDPYRFLKSSWTLDTLDRLLGALGKSCGLR